MNFDIERVRRFAPVALAVVVLAVGWMFLVSPVASRNAERGRQVDTLRQRLTQVRASLNEPPPEAILGDPVADFVSRVAAGDASSSVLEQLASQASAARATNLLIETGERVVLTDPSGPQVAGGVQVDPRFQLFNTSLSYSPVAMSFDAEFQDVGTLLWRLRDLPTAIEIRTLEITPSATPPRVHVAMTLFAYARVKASTGTGATP